MKRFIFTASLLVSLSFGLIYGQETVTDQDGNVYPVIEIAGTEWMGENLRAATYRNGDPITHGAALELWQSSSEGLWVNYDNDDSNDLIYGKLYNWYAVADNRGICPVGWRIPTHEDWDIFTQNIDPEAWGNNNRMGNYLKSRRQDGSPLGGEFDTDIHPRWDSHHKRFGLDTYDFSALPAGAYHPGFGFSNKGTYAYFWTSTINNNQQAWARVFLHSHRGMSRSAYRMETGFSVRCVKGEGEPVIIPPVVETVSVTSITTTSATVTGNVVHNGGGVITERRILYANHTHPTTDNHLGSIDAGTGTGTFEVTLEELTPETTYYARAWASNQAGASYGQVRQFTTQPEIIFEYVLSLSAIPTGGGTVSGSGVYAEGFEVLLEANPHSGFIFSHWEDNEGNIISEESSFTFVMPAGNKLLRAVFTPLSLAELLTLPATHITQNSARSGGEILNDGGSPISSNGLVWASFSDPTVGNNEGISEESVGGEAFESDMLGLQPGSTYYVRAWATNSVGTSYGQEEVFTTEEVVMPMFFLTLEDMPDGSGQLEGQGEYSEGTEIELSATPNEGYAFVHWKMEEEVVSPEASFTYIMPSENVTLTAHFEEIPDVQVNEIVVENAEGIPGETLTIHVSMNNTNTVIAFQMDILIPVEFTFVNGSYVAGPRSSSHSSQQQVMAGNKLRILTFSADNLPIEGNEGLLFSFQLDTSEISGEWLLDAENVILTDVDFEAVLPNVVPGVMLMQEE